MVRISELLKKEEIGRAGFDEHKISAYQNAAPRLSGNIMHAEDLYANLLSYIRFIFSKVLNSEPIDLHEVGEKINLLIDYVLTEDQQLMRLVDTHDSQEDYLAVHSLNVCILSLDIGHGLNYTRERLLDLGVGAFLHDIGMVKLKNVLAKERNLYNVEYEEVKNHTHYGAALLGQLEGVSENIISILKEHHERADASGYPQGFALGDISEYARIVGLADVYEALVHSRPHRGKKGSFEQAIVREMISSHNMFDPYILRIFIERVTRHHPSYMLWLAADGVYQALDEFKKMRAQIGVLGAQVNTAQNSRRQVIERKNKFPFVLAIILGLLAAIFLFVATNRNNEIFYPFGQSLYFAQNRAPLKIEYNFLNNASDVYSMALDLPNINLSKYNQLYFSAKVAGDLQGKSRNNMAILKIEVENSRSEKSEYFVQGVNAKWQEFKIPFSVFQEITDWSSIKRVSFYLHPWNIAFKKGIVYVDQMRFFKKNVY